MHSSALLRHDILPYFNFYWANYTGYGKSFRYAYLPSMFDNIDNDALSYIVQRFLINRISFVEARNARVIRPFLKDQLYQTTSVS